MRAEIAEFVSDLGKARGEVERTAAQMKRALQEQSRQAKDSVDLLSYSIGVEIPRELKKVISQSSLLGPALSAAFRVSAVGAFASVIVSELSPAIKDAAMYLGGYTAAVKEAYAAEVKFNKELAESASKLAKARQEFELVGLKGSARTQKEFEQALREESALQARLRDAQNVIFRQTSGLSEPDPAKLAQARRDIEKLPEDIEVLQIKQATLQQQYIEQVAEATRNATKEQIEAFRKVVEGLKELPIKNERITDLLFPLRFDKDLLAAGEHAMKLAQPLEAVEVGLAKLVNPAKDAQKSIREMFQEYDRGVIHAVLGQGKVFEQIEKSREAVRKFGHDIGDSLKQLIVHGANARQVFQALLFDVASFLFNKYALPGFGKTGFSGFLGSLFGGIFGGGKQHGGPVEAGRAYVVGEAGPELFFPRMSGAIVPALAGGVTNVFNIDARGAADPSGIFRAAERLKREAAALAVAIVEERRRRR